MNLRATRLLLSALLLTGLPVLARAATIDPPTVTINGWSPTLTQLGCSADNGVETCTGSNLTRPNGSVTLKSWNLTLDPDPTVTGALALQNNLGSPQTFNVTFLVPIVPQGPQVTINGSIGGSATDANSNGVTLSTSPPSIYQAQIDGVTVQTLLNDPQSFSAGSGGTAGFGPAGFGPTTLNQTANSTIAIKVIFTLSPGDIASFTSVFNVVAVPEPGTLMLLGGGLLGLWAFARRQPSA